MASLEENDVLSPLEDSRRFLTMDRQLLALFQVLGNGVISGWDVTLRSGLTVAVSPGTGNISFMGARTTDPTSVVGLAPNSTNYIYASATNQTRFDNSVSFTSDTVLFGANQSILLAKVTTNASSVVSVDTTVRTDIGFIAVIKDLINKHRHRGGLDNPSKIDLASEVIGQLPGFRIAGLDSAQIISGRLDPARVPTLEHGDLLYSGVLTHAQLDSFVRNLSNPNARLLGELSATNMLQLWMAQKHIWNDCDSQTDNLLVMIPGISPDSFTDFNATTAIVDKFHHTISGVPALQGQLLTTTFRTKVDFDSAFLNVNVQTGTLNQTTSFFKLTKPFSETIVDGFDNVFYDGTTFPGWTLETIASNNQSSFTSDASEKVDGAFSAKLNLNQSFTIQATKFFTVQDWTNYNELQVSIQTLSEAHGQIFFSILGGTQQSPTVLASFQLLNQNQVTAGFVTIVQDLLAVTRTAVIGVRIYTDTALGWDLSPVTLNIDAIKLNNNLFFTPAGVMRFRYETPQSSKWASISWDADLNGGSIQVRSRSAPNFAILDQSSAIPFQPATTTSGADPLVVDNPCIEFEMTLATNVSKTATPVVRSVTISYISNNQNTGLSIDTTQDFLRATKFGNTIVQDPGDVLIDGRIDVGDVVYGHPTSLQQVDSFGTPVFGVTGSALFLSPSQAATTDFISRQPSMNGVTTAQKLSDRTYLLTDTMNDRVLLFDKNGSLVNGLASNNVRNLTSLYPLTATFNPTNGILYICWSTNVSLKGIDLSQMTIRGSGVVIPLSNSIDSVSRVQGVNSDLASSNVVAVVLAGAHVSELKDFLSSTGVTDSRLFLEVGANAAKEGVDLTSPNFATLTGPRGMNIFVGNVKFIAGIFRPISVNITAAGNWLIGNAKPLATDASGGDLVTGVGKSEITSTVELNPLTGLTVFSDDSVDFTIETLGAAIEFSNGRYVAVSGIVQDKTNATTSSSTTTTPGQGTTAAASPVSATQALAGYRGRTKIIEKASGRVVFEQPTSDGTFGADVQVDPDLNLIVIEKAFNGAIGKGRVVRLDEDGNVFFQYGLNELAAPNDVRLLSNGNLVVSS